MNSNLRSFLIVSLALGAITASKGSQSPAISISTEAPCMDVLHLFTAPEVPSLAPSEIAVPELPKNAFVRPGLPGGGLERHPMLYVGSNYHKMFLVKDGKVIWTYATGPSPEFDDIWMMSNGNILFSHMQYVAVISPNKKVLWRYDAVTSMDAKKTEIHACQPIGLDKIMFVENGLPPRLKVINIKTGAVEVDHELPFEEKRGVHGQFRRARVTAQGTYLISFLNLGRVVEYDKDFKEIWKYEIPTPWAAIRLKNGNTLITNEKDSLTREVNPKGETVWEFNCLTDLPAEYQFTFAPQSCTRLANGNTIFISREKGGDGPQLIEVTPDKKVVSVLQDWKTLGGATAVQILNDPGIPEVPGESEH